MGRLATRHVISVLMRKKVNEVPSRYISDRWRKDIKCGYTAVKSAYHDSDDEQRQRNKKLTPLLFEVQHLGMESDARCELLVKLLQEAKEKLFEIDSIPPPKRKESTLQIAEKAKKTVFSNTFSIY
ncbi:hypothetical protein Acr_01g0011020 [Actinidia rufa]|uniref:Protein FAR1-RELATED SEQUENCE n=1 Tax=Actinidia rufa TaxID=165716 RepID=A0A7J0E468_9ERIC|nr:hypothetical protein Acr_01g0011020 [Actinidia rufa]